MYRIYHIYDKEHTYFPAGASFRSRFMNPAKSLLRQNVISKCVNKPQPEGIHIYHKHFCKESLEWIKQTGGIFDITDYHFKKKEEEYYREMCRHADIITCPTNEMSRLIQNETGRRAVEIVQDPYDGIEFEEQEPAYQDTKTVCWFGHKSNLWTLENQMIHCGGELVSNCAQKMVLDKSWKYTAWKPSVMKEVFKRHDIVIIPYGDTQWQHCKSPNRVVDSLYSGKIVVTNYTPVIEGLERFVILNNDISEGVKWVWKNSASAIAKTRDGQEYVKEYYSPLKISERWKEIIQMEDNILQARKEKAIA